MSSSRAPRRRRTGLLVESVGDETLVYDLERHTAHCLNRIAASVWEACDGEKDVAAIAAGLAAASPGASRAVVDLALERLARARLLDGAPRAMPRRAALRRLSVAAGLLPVVSSILVPEPAQAASCSPAGGCCINKADCCPGLNCVGPHLPQCPPALDKSCR